MASTKGVLIVSYKKSIPVFETMTTFYFLYLSVVMTVFPELIGSDKSEFYQNISSVLPPASWAFLIFGIAMTLSIGLYTNKPRIRMFGLVLATFVYLIFALAFARSFPNFSTGLYVLLTLAALSAIATVTRTEL